jgi:hypothetical protein
MRRRQRSSAFLNRAIGRRPLSFVSAHPAAARHPGEVPGCATRTPAGKTGDARRARPWASATPGSAAKVSPASAGALFFVFNVRSTTIGQHRGHARRENVPRLGPTRCRDGGARRHHRAALRNSLTGSADEPLKLAPDFSAATALIRALRPALGFPDHRAKFNFDRGRAPKGSVNFDEDLTCV